MADLEDYRMSPKKFEAFLKKCASTSSIIYEANVEQFKQAIREGKIKMLVPEEKKITVGNGVVSGTCTYKWVWLGE